jgi:threonine dehydrogenase-like Zn-dependent dehydrogenase
VVEPGVSNSIQMRSMPDPAMSADQVAVRMIRVGLCGTDSEISRGLYGQAPDGEQFLILGHENFGVIEDVGREVTGFAAGDLVVSTVRRPCGVCPQCAAGESDMCSSGQYTERGIMRRHGFMAERYVEHPVYLNKIPPDIRDIAVLLEPMSIVQKGVEQAFLLQRRFSWTPRAAMVLGAGPVGLLAAAVLRARKLETTVVGREETSDLRAQIATQLGAKYISVATRPLADVVTDTAFPDLIVEATGNASVAFSAMSMLALNGVLCLLSVTGGHAQSEEPIDVINQRLVLGNRVVFGSVNANERHFQHGVQDFVAIEKAWPGALQRMLTDPIPWQQHQRWFAQRGSGIKATLEIGR